ncbi:type II secretion system protein [bacterium]|nr:type II secretion system protein [bacterium]
MTKRNVNDLTTSSRGAAVAFTLAEVLITLAIIGVVAALTIPTLVANNQQKGWDTASTVFNRRLGEALKIMNINGALAGYNSTEDFVNELSKHIKITKTCSSDKLTDCFTSEINITDGDPIKTSDLKKSKNLYETEDYGTETIGVQFADGVSALIAYNKNVLHDPYSNDIVRLTQNNGKSVGLSTKALSILYDVSGNKTPNSYGTGKDIRGLNISFSVVDIPALPEGVGITFEWVDDTYTEFREVGSTDVGDNECSNEVGLHYNCKYSNSEKTSFECLYNDGEYKCLPMRHIYTFENNTWSFTSSSGSN